MSGLQRKQRGVNSDAVMTDGDPLTFTVKGADRKAVESRTRELLDGPEKQGKYDYLLDVRKSGDDCWRGTVVVNFHKKRYNESQ